MAIAEAQLEIWTGLGSVQQSSATYQSIKNVLESRTSPHAARDFDVFLQGSYGNDTNIHGDSDVDIVIRQKNLFYYDVNNLTQGDRAEFDRAFPTSAQDDLASFKADVVRWLAQNYQGEFDPNGNKAVYIRARGNRRNADVLICAQHKRFTAFPNSLNQRFSDGVIFLPRNGGSIVNYPKQHSDNMTNRHQQTNQWLKPLVRIFKNMRNRMITDGRLTEGVAPSYFIEGLLYNVPIDNFGISYQTTVARCLTFAATTDRTQLACANMQHWLVRDNELTSWPSANYATFINSAIEYWD